jgi:hypothetical protein
LLTISSPRSAGTTEASAASTAAVPDREEDGVERRGDPQHVHEPAPAVAHDLEELGSRWQRSGVSSACRTRALVLAGPGLSSTHSRSAITRSPG